MILARERRGREYPILNDLSFAAFFVCSTGAVKTGLKTRSKESQKNDFGKEKVEFIRFAKTDKNIRSIENSK